MNNEQVTAVINILIKMYPNARTGLTFKSPYELLIATILSAQCTDKRVNMVTKELFKKYPNAKSLAGAELTDIEEDIKKCGLYKTKSKNIINACKIISEKYNGSIPENRDDLMSLPGVGRKTANVVLSNAFGVDTIAVDTHVFRVSNRIGLVDAKDVVKTENELVKVLPKGRLSLCHHLLINHGRNMCKARKPMCSKCDIRSYCNYYLTREGEI